ncbi:MAG: hypothetical protein JWN10_1664, partial [Solirubrobacterales bacterium]|nr:hypothetical protein [Solirubrobacterales bacterium]
LGRQPAQLAARPDLDAQHDRIELAYAASAQERGAGGPTSIVN